MSKSSKLTWGGGFLFLGLGTVVSMFSLRPINSSETLDLLTVISGILLVIATIIFGWHRAPFAIGTLPRSILIIGSIALVMFGVRSKVGPRPIIEISKEFKLASVDIGPNIEANIGVLKDGPDVEFSLCRNDGSIPFNWVHPDKKTNPAPGTMYLYHVFNQNPYPVTNMKLTFTANFMNLGEGSKITGTKVFDIYIKNIAGNANYDFYVLNASHSLVTVISPEYIDVQLPGERVFQAPVITGKEIFGTFPISDIDPQRPGLDFPLMPTPHNWATAGCYM